MNFAVTGTQRPTYPSSKPTRVDWDKLEAQVKSEVCLLLPINNDSVTCISPHFF